MYDVIHFYPLYLHMLSTMLSWAVEYEPQGRDYSPLLWSDPPSGHPVKPSGVEHLLKNNDYIYIYIILIYIYIYYIIIYIYRSYIIYYISHYFNF